MRKVYEFLEKQKDLISNKILNNTKIIETCERTSLEDNTILPSKQAAESKKSRDEIRKACENEIKFYEAKLTQLNKYIEVAEELKTSKDKLFILEEYQSGDQKISRYGINNESEKLVELVDKFNPIEQTYYKQITKITVEIEANSSSSGKTGSSKSGTKDQQKIKKTLNFLELVILEQAMKLNKDQSSIFDIFKKDEANVIQMEKQTEKPTPEVHCVVLHKDCVDSIMMIDPTDSTYSTHVADNFKLYSKDATIKAPTQKVTIYTPNSKEVGDGPTNYRDCTDIAVKIALRLNNSKLTIDVEKLMEIADLQLISNHSMYNEHLPSSTKNLALRIKQSSKQNIQNKFDEYSKFIDAQEQSISKYPTLKKEFKEQIKSSQQKVFNEINKLGYFEYEEAIKELCKTYQDGHNEFIANLQATLLDIKDSSLLGENTQ